MNNQSASGKHKEKNEASGKQKETTIKPPCKKTQDDLRQALDMPDARPSQFQGHVGI